MIITTTNSIENAIIESYLGIITTNIVVGTNLFSDLAAPLTDIFWRKFWNIPKQTTRNLQDCHF